MANLQDIDGKRFEEHDGALCMLCGAYGNDKRSLLISCFYDISEVIPETIRLDSSVGPTEETIQGNGFYLAGGFYLRICKVCRGGLLVRLQEWREERVALRDVPKDSDGYVDEADTEGLIPYRKNGMTVFLTQEQWEKERSNNNG